LLFEDEKAIRLYLAGSSAFTSFAAAGALEHKPDRLSHRKRDSATKRGPTHRKPI
jgi:hypothetical protein